MRVHAMIDSRRTSKFHYDTTNATLTYDDGGTIVTLATLDASASVAAHQMQFV